MAEFTKEQLVGWANSLIEETHTDISISRTDAHAESHRAQLELLEIALAALTAPQLPQPAVLSVSEGVLKSLLPDVEKPEFWFEHNGKIFFEGVRFNNAVFEACRVAMLQSFGNSEQLDEVGSWNNHMNTPTANPAIDTGALLKHIEGMEVSVDVSTCDADAGHRYFGTVTEISELDTAKNGYILLVQDAKPNFKPAGNSPATPDGWIPVSERMPESHEPIYIFHPDYGVDEGVWYDNQEDAFLWDSDCSRCRAIETVSHWMPMPAPPAAPQQEE